MRILIVLTALPAVFLTSCKGEKGGAPENADTASPAPAAASGPGEKAPDPVGLLRTHLSLEPEKRPGFSAQPFATMPLTRAQAETAAELLLADRLATLRAERKKEFDQKTVTLDGKTMRYEFRTFGKAPEGGYSLYISMHGGGGAPPRVNDQQWQNQIRLYQPEEGIYVAPRAPTDTWDLWHQAHIDAMFDQLIADFTAFKGINPDKVYVMGYSAGGDGAYQLAPRMADRWAAAAMMAGHPGDAQTWNLRNLPYIIQCGGKDHAYNRANLCAEWGSKLDKLAKSDPGGYPHKCIVYPQYGHWMNREDAVAVTWMAKHTRNPWPKKLHWYQDNVTHTRFFWFSNNKPEQGQLISAKAKGNTITLYDASYSVQHSPLKGAGEFTAINSITLRLSDQLLDLGKPVTVKGPSGKVLLEKKIPRTAAAIAQSIRERPDASSAASATVTIQL